MDRRRLLGFFASGGLAGRAAAQPVAPARRVGDPLRIGELRPTSPPPPGDLAGRLLQEGLRAAGITVGQDVVIVSRYAGGVIARLPDLARELVRERVDVIFAVGSQSANAARLAAPQVPIVFFGNFDPVASGLVSSLAQPGGSATGVLIASEGTLAAKRLQLLTEAVPHARRIALLAPDDPAFRLQADEVHRAALELRVEVVDVTVAGGDYERAFERAVAARTEAMFVGAHTYAFRDRRRIIDLAARHRLPATYEWPEQAEDGGFMAYGTSLRGTYAAIASYLERILRGARPGALPVIQPTQFQLVVNRATARTLGIVLPQALLLRADRVIE